MKYESSNVFNFLNDIMQLDLFFQTLHQQCIKFDVWQIILNPILIQRFEI